MTADPRVACFATQGPGSPDEARVRDLLAPLEPEVLAFDRSARLRGARRLARELRARAPDVVVMEGIGVGGWIALASARRPYVVSTGDAVGPFHGLRGPLAGWLGERYERRLLGGSAGAIGWTPYLAGRAVTLGAPRAMSAPGWATDDGGGPSREELRAALGIATDALVFGLVGSLKWTPSRRYAYGLELVRAIRAVDRDEVVVLVVGDGTGRERLAAEAGDLLGGRVLLPGAVPRAQVMAHLRAMDVLSLPQSTDAVGALRYSTKLPEYLSAGRPVVTGQIPLAYDLGGDWLWRLPGDAPWSPEYVGALAQLMRTIAPPELERRAAAVPRELELFDRARQQRAAAAFVSDVAAAHR